MFTGRFTVSWTAQAIDLPRSVARLVCLALLCLEKSLPMGGHVRVEVGPTRVSLAVEGRRTAPPHALWAHVRDGAPLAELKPDGVQFALLRQKLAEGEHRLEASFDDTAAEIGIIVDRPAMAEAQP